MTPLARLAKTLLGLETPLGSLAAPFELVPFLLPYSHPIMITRKRSIEDRNLSLVMGPQPLDQQQPTGHPTEEDGGKQASKQPQHSFLLLRYPFSSSPELRRAYSLPPGQGHNISLWLEDMDTFAADVGGRHCDVHRGDKKQVTAMLERLTWLDHGEGAGGSRNGDVEATSTCETDTAAAFAGPSSRPGYDMSLAGQVTWVGKSSMEVTLELWAHPATSPTISAGSPTSTSNDVHGNRGTVHTKDGGARAVAIARFLMAARSVDMSCSVSVPQLDVAGPGCIALDRARFELGEADHHRRQERRHREKARHPPDAAELEALAALMSRLDHHAGSPQQTFDGLPAAQLPSTSIPTSAPTRADRHATNTGTAATVPMASTRTHHVTTTAEHDVNTTGATFGGHLLRLGYEHAARVVAAHAGGGLTCRLLNACEVAFLALVPIGTDLHLDGRVVLVEGDVVRVHVSAYFLQEHVHKQTGHGHQGAGHGHQGTGQGHQGTGHGQEVAGHGQEAAGHCHQGAGHGQEAAGHGHEGGHSHTHHDPGAAAPAATRSVGVGGGDLAGASGAAADDAGSHDRQGAAPPAPEAQRGTDQQHAAGGPAAARSPAPPPAHLHVTKGRTVAQTFWFAFRAVPAVPAKAGKGGQMVAAASSVPLVAPESPEEVELFLRAYRQHAADTAAA